MTRTLTPLLDQPLGPCWNSAIGCEQDRRLLGIFSPPPNARFQVFSQASPTLACARERRYADPNVWFSLRITELFPRFLGVFLRSES